MNIHKLKMEKTINWRDKTITPCYLSLTTFGNILTVKWNSSESII